MGVYLVESFLPDDRAAAMVAAAPDLLTTAWEGRVLQILTLPQSELCLWVVEAPSPDAASTAVRGCGLTVDSLPEVVEVRVLGIDNNRQE